MGKGRNPTTQVAEFNSNRLMNFSCLASDSEEEVLEEVLEDVESEGSESDSEESESESESEEKPQTLEQNQLRVWKGEESRFSSVKNIFSSPFSRKKRRAKEEEWVSILGNEQGQGQGQGQRQELSSLLNRGNDISEEQNALAWAEKVKLTLERAGQNRSELKRTAAKSEDNSNVSFFRRSIVLDENF